MHIKRQVEQRDWAQHSANTLKAVFGARSHAQSKRPSAMFRGAMGRRGAHQLGSLAHRPARAGRCASCASSPACTQDSAWFAALVKKQCSRSTATASFTSSTAASIDGLVPVPAYLLLAVRLIAVYFQRVCPTHWDRMYSRACTCFIAASHMRHCLMGCLADVLTSPIAATCYMYASKGPRLTNCLNH